MTVVNHADDPAAGTRQVPFSREIYIERDDFMETPAKKFFRLSPGREVRLRNAYLVTCTEVVKDASGQIVELRGTYDPATRGGDAPDGRKVKATLHWVSAAHAVDAEVRLYDRLFTVGRSRRPGGAIRHRHHDAAQSRLARGGARAASSSRCWRPPPPAAATSSSVSVTSPSIPTAAPGAPVFNRTVSLKDTWAKVARTHVDSGR